LNFSQQNIVSLKKKHSSLQKRMQRKAVYSVFQNDYSLSDNDKIHYFSLLFENMKLNKLTTISF